MYRSADGKVVAAAAKETGTATLTYPCDESFYVTDGWVRLNVHGGDHFVLTKGEFVYLKKGTTVDFTFGPGFANVAVFMDSEPFCYNSESEYYNNTQKLYERVGLLWQKREE
ncbi:hypothetical protein PCH_Pc14g01020 [Penicillium rubens Wisconsin 54-1255]|uniref:(S)-ureidoglycine aminohydrolase cupin domain-containing protein n=1 Tax=Penicillium rubens (strain ATCC 28089 / DSM 1075 / NRRL 1951 / Wisconsin 54-1255) TaxID=500485 RepID=B6H5T0_PENRW|nr:hypothetical protein PCH_Pc14g01020 [Penicillium rubens Wisconsin 54-1255]